MFRSGHSVQLSPEFRLLQKDQLDDIHDASMEILIRTGIDVHNEEALNLLRKGGAFVDGKRVCIPEHLIDWAVRTAPHNIDIYTRTGELAMQLGRRRSYFGTGSDTVAVIDPYTGQRRTPVLADIGNLARVCDKLANIDFVMCMGMASDVHWYSSELYHFYAMISNTVKPNVYTATSLERLQHVVEMAETVAGGAEAFRQKPFGIHYIEPMTPLVFGAEPMEKLLYLAGKGIPTLFMSGGQAGSTLPVTLAGALALSNAESLGGVLIAQLKREGAPVISGGGTLGVDMASGAISYGAPLFMTSVAAIAEIAQYYGLPAWGYSGCTDAKVFDEQAAADAGMWTMISALSGSNLVHDVGYLESGLTSSYEMIVFSDEMIAKTRSMFGEVRMDRDAMAVDAIHRVGPGGEFLTDPHTYKNFRAGYFPTLEDRSNYENWVAGGSLAMRDRVNAKVRGILETHKPLPIPTDLDAKLKALLKAEDDRAKTK
jgi:trimethylamine---corrinoid protein Co-methyltransferase